MTLEGLCCCNVAPELKKSESKKSEFDRRMSAPGAGTETRHPVSYTHLMPGILAEVSFVSSPTDEQKLRSDGYREQVAEALYKGIAGYAASSHGIKVASARR